MPLFGPNINKMKEKGDIGGLLALLKADNLQTRVEAIEALKDIGERGVELLIKEFADIFRFGNEADRVQAITIMQGRSEGLGAMHLLLDKLWGVGDFSKVKFARKFDLDLARPILLDLAANTEENSAIRWYALIACVELGDRSNEVVQALIDVLNNMPKMNEFTMEESLRALSYFPNNPDTIAVFVQLQKGHFLRWKANGVLVGSAAIYALGATGDFSAREYLEYLATHGNEFYRKKAQIALQLFGKASYDEIEAKAEAK